MNNFLIYFVCLFFLIFSFIEIHSFIKTAQTKCPCFVLNNSYGIMFCHMSQCNIGIKCAI